MVKRICLVCGAENYSADTINRYWTCYKCGAQIPKEVEKPIDAHRNQADKDGDLRNF